MIEFLSAIKDMFSHHIIFSMGLILVAGYLLGKGAEYIRFPAITGYIIAGILLGDSVTGLIHIEISASLKVVTEIALGLIALTIGGEFAVEKIKRKGRKIIIITLFQLFITFGIVSVSLFLFRLPLLISLLLGAVATATAPAATVAIVQSLRVRGEFIDYLYGIVALDDAGCVIIFAVTFAIVSALAGAVGTSAFGPVLHVLSGILEIILSLVIGFISGVIIHMGTRRNRKRNEVLIITLGMILLTTSISIMFHLSSLLANMMLGATLINLSIKNHRIFTIIEPLTPPIYAAFFAIAGTELNIGILGNVSILVFGLIFIIARMAGKYGGVYIGAALTKTQSKIRRYLGLCMFPQAGVAIGLVLLLQGSPVIAQFPPASQLFIDQMINIVIFSVFINELAGPPLSKFAIVKGADIA
jgi:Kef-type K+ transport system membrane component KefB